MTITATTLLKTACGKFKVGYHEHGNEFCVSFTYGDITKGSPAIRFQSACLFGETLHSTMCDCKQQLEKAIELIKNNWSGVLIYSYKEGRGIGLKSKILSMEIERVKGVATAESYKMLGFSHNLLHEEEDIKLCENIGLKSHIAQSPEEVRGLILEEYERKGPAYIRL